MSTLLADSICVSSVTPLVSICIPTYKRVAKLHRALESAVAQASSSTLFYEIVIVDNDPIATFCISDLLGGKKISQSTGLVSVRLYRNSTNLGLYGNWNQCIRFARGHYMTILSDDDLLFSSWLACSENVISQYPKIKSFGFASIHVNSSDNIKLDISVPRPSMHQVTLYQIFQGSPFSGLSTVVFERIIAKEYMFTILRSIGYAGDYLFLLNLYMRFPVYISNSALAIYNTIENTSSSPFAQAQFILGQYCARSVLINCLIVRGLRPAFSWYSKYHAFVSALMLKRASPSAFYILTRRLPALVNYRFSYASLLFHRLLLKTAWFPLLFCHNVITYRKKVFP